MSEILRHATTDIVKLRSGASTLAGLSPGMRNHRE
jgi:hypothetical protein